MTLRRETRASTRDERLQEDAASARLGQQGPFARAVMPQIVASAAAMNGGGEILELEAGPMARATMATFPGPSSSNSSSSNNKKRRVSSSTAIVPSSLRKKSIKKSNTADQLMAVDQRCSLTKIQRDTRQLTSIATQSPISLLFPADERTSGHHRMTRSITRKIDIAIRSEKLEQVLAPVLASGFLVWYEALRLGCVNRGCRAVWIQERETAANWKTILNELNTLNCTNKCPRCEQIVLLKANRNFCLVDEWNRESSKRTPNFVSCVDILMRSNMLNWRERGGIRRICKATYKVHKEQCTCRNPVDRTISKPFLKLDPRYQSGYDEEWSDYEKCEAMIRYTQLVTCNLHSFYNFKNISNPNRLPYGLAGWTWYDIQMINLQRKCPRRYAFVMNLVSLFIAQGELQRSPPVWYASAFLGSQHNPYEESFVESMGTGISEFCLPATDEVLVRFLRTRCYPSHQTLKLLGPLLNQVSIFSPFFKMVPMDESQRVELPETLEDLTDELIDSMSMNFICTVM
jgi:hypothetical protein